jgi:hypothetical protein
MKSATNKLKAPLAAFGGGSSSSSKTSSGSDKSLVGVTGRTYGLQIRGDGGKATTGAPVKKAPLSVFKKAVEDDDDDGNDAEKKRLIATGNAHKKKVMH